MPKKILDEDNEMYIEENPLIATFDEVAIISLVILTFGALLSCKKRVDTSKSYIHCIFAPLDRIMLDT